MIKVKDGYGKLIGSEYKGSADLVLLSDGSNLGYAIPSTGNTLVLRNTSGQIESSLTTDSNLSPFVVTSTVVNTNLNSDLLDGFHAGGLFLTLSSSTSVNLTVKIGNTEKKIEKLYATYDGLGNTIATKYVTLDTALTISGVKTFSSLLKFTVSSVSPFTVDSNIVVTNLNADLLDGTHKADLFTDFSNITSGTDANKVSITIGGTTKKIIINYAQNAGSIGGITAEGLFTALTSTPAKNLSITIGGTTKDIISLYSNYWVPQAIGSKDFNTMYGDTYRGTSWYGGGSNTATNNPLGSGLAFGMLVWRNADGYTALLIMGSDGRLYVRVWNGSSWSQLLKFAYATDAGLGGGYWANLPVLTAADSATKPTFAEATATTQVTTPKVHSTSRLTLNATSTGLDLKFNNDATKSVILNGTEFKPFDSANGNLDLGASNARWKGLFAGTGDFTGIVRTTGDGFYLASTSTYPRSRWTYTSDGIWLLAANWDGNSIKGTLWITGHNADNLTKLNIKSDNTNYNGTLSITSDGRIVATSESYRQAGMYGIYDSTKVGHIWSMGTSFAINANGSNTGNLYGLAYFHTNWSNASAKNDGSKTEVGPYAGNHQAAWVINGRVCAALGNYVWSRNGFIKHGSSDNYVLLGGGGHTAISTLTPTGYYWANVKISATSSTTTTPTFGNTTINGTLTMGNIIITKSGSSQQGIKFGSSYLNQIDNQLLWQSYKAIRFGSSNWNWDEWAGLKYVPSTKTIHLGLADGTVFTANSGQSGGTLNLPRISHITSSYYKMAVGHITSHTPSAAGWYRVAKITGYFNYDIHTTGDWNHGMPSTVKVNISQINGTAKITLLAGYVGSIASSIRLGKVATDEWDVLFYVPAYSGPIALQNFIFFGYGSITVYSTNTASTTSYSATTDLSFTTITGNNITSNNYANYVGNMYWANVKVSATSSTTTTPTFANTTVNGVLAVNGGAKTVAITHNHTLTTAWNDFITCLNPKLTTTYHTAHIAFGRTYTSKNTGYIGFKYAGDTSNSNMVTIGLHSVDNILNILASGNVGIGTTSPSYKLHINGTSHSSNYQAGAELYLKAADTTCQTTIFGSNGSGYRMRIIRLSTAADLNTLYSPTLVVSSLDTHAYIAWSYSSDNVWVGGGSGNKWKWRSKLVTSNNYGSYLGYIGTTPVQKSAAAQALTGITRISNSASNVLYLGNANNTGWVLTLDICSHSGTSKWAINANGQAWFSKLMVGIAYNGTGSNYAVNVSGDSHVTGWSRANNGFYVEGTGVHYTHQGTLGEINMINNNEFLWSTSNGSLYFNYRAASRGRTVTNYIWNAGSSGTYANHTIGALQAYGPITVTYNAHPGLTVHNNTTSGESSIYVKNNTAGWALGVNPWGLGAGQFAIGQYSGTGSSSWRFRIDNNGYCYTNSYLNLGGGHEKNASSPTYVWGSTSSDTFLRSYQTSKLSVNYANSAGSASSSGYIWGNSISNLNTPTTWSSDGTRLVYDTYSGSASNKPVSVDNANGLVTFFKSKHSTSNQYVSLLAFPDHSRFYFRYAAAGSWGSWQTVAFTSDIPNPGNYYWANVRVSASSNAYTTPQFGKVTIYDGTNAILSLKTTTAGAYAYLAAYNTGGQYGADVVLHSGSAMVLGSGESAASMYDNNVDSLRGSENLYLTADTLVKIFTNCDSIGNRKHAATFTTDGYSFFHSYINIGGHEKNASSPSYVWGSNSTDNYLRSYQTSKLSVNYANSAGTSSYVVVHDSNANSTHRMVWHSGNTLYSTNNIYCNPSTDQIYSAGFRHVSYNSASYLLRSDGGAAAFNWSGQSGQPNWLWGGNSQHTYYVYNPSNFNVNSAAKLRVVSCYNGTTNNDLWSTIKSSNSSYLGTSTMYEVYNDGGPTTYGHVLDTVTVHSNHWQSQLWMAAGKGGRLYYRNKDYNNNTWGNWGTVAFTSDIPNPANYYWANIRVSASSSTGTLPTFNTCWTSNWFRSTGTTGWYSESYGGGIHMLDSTWVRTYNGKSFYCSAVILAGNRIYTGYDSGLANSISCSNWFRSNGTSGWYNPTYECHVYPNNIGSYGGLVLRGTKNSYHGALLGPSTNHMVLMSNDVHHGLYCEATGVWEFYYNRSSSGVGIRTSTITKNFNVSGQSYLSSKTWIGTTSGAEMLNVGGWVGTTGSTGWYNISYAGGIYMEDSTWVRIYNNKKFYVNNSEASAIHSAGGVYVAGPVHSYANYLKSTCSGKTITIGSANASYCHYLTDAPAHWFNKTVHVAGHVYGGTNYNRRLAYVDEIPGNTWRGVENVLTSTSTSNSLTANMGRVLANGASDRPIVLLAGTLYRSGASSSYTTWYFTGYRHRSISSSNPTVYVSGGVARFYFTNASGYGFSFAQVCANHQASGEATGYQSGEYQTRSSGLFWFGTYASGLYLYIRAIALGDRNNDTAESYTGMWKNYSDGVTRVSIIAVGYAW